MDNHIDYPVENTDMGDDAGQKTDPESRPRRGILQREKKRDQRRPGDDPISIHRKGEKEEEAGQSGQDEFPCVFVFKYI